MPKKSPPLPRSLSLEPLAPEEFRRTFGLPPGKRLSAKFPKRALGSAAEARAALRKWQDAQPLPAPVRNSDVPIKSVRLNRQALKKLHAVAQSEVAPAEILRQKLTADSLFGTLHSALTAYEFMKMQAEYKRRKAGRGPFEKTEEEWRQVVQAARMAYTAAGLSSITEKDLSSFVKELSADRTNLNTVIRLADTAVPSGKGTTLTTRTRAVASLVSVHDKFIDDSALLISIRDLCSKPLTQGQFTKHFSYSLSLSVNITYWCPTWTNPFRTCTKNVTLAGVSFSLGVDVGYEISCCGATIWGQAGAQVCATILGISVCASCTATIIGVAGVSRTPVSSGCSYGLGINATLKCSLFGQNILNISYPFGWTVVGPCPPFGLCPGVVVAANAG